MVSLYQVDPDARLDRRTSVALGAFAGVLGVAVVMPGFYPLGRLFDPSVGGDQPVGLATELVLGTIGGLLLSPLAAGIGAFVGWCVGGRSLTVLRAAGLIASAALLAVGLLSALSGGQVDDAGSTNSLRFAGVHGALAGTVFSQTFAHFPGVSRTPPAESGQAGSD